MGKAAEARQDRALVLLLEALPAERLELVLEELGISPERRAAAADRRDKRRCGECGNGYLRCREIDAKATDKHEWQPRIPGVPEPREATP